MRASTALRWRIPRHVQQGHGRTNYGRARPCHPSREVVARTSTGSDVASRPRSALPPRRLERVGDRVEPRADEWPRPCPKRPTLRTPRRSVDPANLSRRRCRRRPVAASVIGVVRRLVVLLPESWTPGGRGRNSTTHQRSWHRQPFVFPLKEQTAAFQNALSAPIASVIGTHPRQCVIDKRTNLLVF